MGVSQRRTHVKTPLCLQLRFIAPLHLTNVRLEKRCGTGGDGVVPHVIHCLTARVSRCLPCGLLRQLLNRLLLPTANRRRAGLLPAKRSGLVFWLLVSLTIRTLPRSAIPFRGCLLEVTLALSSALPADPKLVNPQFLRDTRASVAR